MSRPSVTIVTTYYRPVLGGAESAAERLARFLQRRGHPVTVLTKRTSSSDAEAETLDGVDVVRLRPIGARSSRGKWAVIPQVFQRLRGATPPADVVCCIDYRGVGLAALAARAFSRVPVIFQAQTEGVISGARVRQAVGATGLSPEGPIARALSWPIRAAYRRADALGCISRTIEREALDAGMPRDRVHYLPNPVDVALFSPAPVHERLSIRAALGIEPNEIVCVFVGRLSREKGVMELVRAWAQARPTARLVLIGPPMTDHPWDVSEDARALVQQEKLTSVTFAGGQPPELVARWLKAADFAAQPSHFEAMGLAAAEEMASGLPVIASDTGGYRDFVVDNETGTLVPVKDINALAAALARFASDHDLRKHLGRQARTRAERFSESVVLEEFAQLIERLAHRD